MLKKTSTTHLLILICIFSLLLIKAISLFWGLKTVDAGMGYFESDEWAHTEIAKEFINSFDKSIVPDQAVTRYWTTWGFGIQMGLFSYPFLKFFSQPNATFITLGGRILSLIYSLAIVLLVFLMAYYIFRDKRIALLSSLLVATFDLIVTYSHYATPDINHIFWYYLSIFLLILRYLPHPSNQDDSDKIITPIFLFLEKYFVPLISLSISMILAVRFDPIPLGMLMVLTTANIIKSKGNRLAESYLLAKILALILFLFLIIHGNTYTLPDIAKAVQKLIEDNRVPYSVDQGFLFKPLVYPIIIISGTSLPVFLIFIFELFYATTKEKYTYALYIYLFFAVTLFLSFLSLYLGPAITVRRAAIFLPFIALVTGSGLINLYRNTLYPKTGVWILYGTLTYTISLTLISQYYFMADTRFQAEEFLKKNFSDKIIFYSEYAYSQGMPMGILLDREKTGKTTILAPRNYDPILVKDYMTRIAPPEREQVIVEPDVVVLHETYYGRYWKSVSTPFKNPPRCCEGVFRCKAKEMCLIEQALLSNQADFKLVKKIEVKHPFPERLIFKKLFGTYETFLGDILIFEKI